MNKSWQNWAILALLSILTTSLVIIWKGSTFPEDYPVSLELITRFSTPELASMTDASTRLADVATDFGWAVLVSQAPFALAYLLFGSGGLFALLLICTFLLLTLVYFIGIAYSTNEVALFTTFIFAISPLTIKFPLDVLSPFSSEVLCLLAIFMAIKAVHTTDPAKKAALWLICGLICVANYYLVDWGIWLPVFIALFALPRKMTHSQVRLLGFLILAFWLLAGAETIADNALFLDNPLRGFLSLPGASQSGYSELIPADFRFALPGNNPALILALVSIVIGAQEKGRSWTLTTLWLVIGLGFNFWFIQEGIEEVFVILIFPVALLIANFFDTKPSSLGVLVSSAVMLILFSVGASMEPKISELVISGQFPGWSTALAFRDFGQISGGVMLVSAFLYIFLQKTLSSRVRSIYLGIIFLLFGFSQVGLMALL